MEAIRWAASQLALFSMRADHLECQNKALQQVNEEAERKLCAAADAGQELADAITFNHLERIQLALSRWYSIRHFPSPCPHAKEAKRLRALAARAEDLEGMASVIFGHMFPDRDGWDAETDERLKECYRSNARAVAAYLKGEK